MMLRIPNQSYLAIGLIITILLLGIVLAVEVKHAQRLGIDVIKAGRSSSVLQIPKQLPEFTLQEAGSSFPDILARPLFLASRRPMLSAGATDQVMKKGQFILTGIAIVSDRGDVLLKDVATGKTERVKQGESVRGMRLEQVDSEKVVLAQGEEREVILLKIQPVKAPPSPAEAKGQAQTENGVKEATPLQSVTVDTPMQQTKEEKQMAAREKQKVKRRSVHEAMNKQRAQKGLPPIPMPPELK